ncbi:MAG: LPS export ABC transporter permease LptG [Pseudomonadota bacterium]
MGAAGTLFRYLVARVAGSAIGVLCALMVLVFLVDLVELLRSLGNRPGVEMSDILLMAFMRAPKLAEQLMPFVFLFGCMWAMANLNRRSELVVMRAAGLSAWRIMEPALAVAVAAGLVLVLVINPLGADLMDRAERLRASSSGDTESLVSLTAGGLWLRQSDGQRTATIHAARVEEKGEFLEDITVFLYDQNEAFQRRIDAETGQLREGDLNLFDCYVNSPDEGTVFQAKYSLSTPFSQDRLREGAAAPETMSIWELPAFIRLAKDAGFPAVRHEMHWHNLIATPFKLCAMALIAGAFAIQQRRGGGTVRLVMLGVGAGFGLYVAAELAEAMGESVLNLAPLAAWTPTIVASLLAATLILHVEDG